MERNKNIDIIRAIAILIILVYHIFAISGVQLFRGTFSPFIEYGGEYGVTLFFMLSGFSIYKSLSKRKENFSYSKFIKDRLKRILPEYYVSLIILMCFTGGNVVLFSNKFDFFSHFFLLHGFYPSIQGSISGVAWALTPIFCFYLISPLLYKSIEKFPKLTVIGSIIFSCIFKYIIYNLFSISVNEIPFATYFVFGKSIFGVIEEFVIGMFLAKYIKTPQNNKKIVLNLALIIISLVALYFWIYVDRNCINIITKNTQRFSACFEAYIWYAVLSIILSIGIFGFSQIKINYEFPISKFLLCISKYEYGIYLWHLEFIRKLCEVNPYIQVLITSNRRIIYLYLGFSTIFLGILMSILIGSVDWKKVYQEFKSYIKIFAIIFGILVIYICVKEAIFQLLGFINGNDFLEYIFTLLYVIGIEAIILYFVKINNRKSKRLISMSIICFVFALFLKIYLQGMNDFKLNVHLDFIVQLFQSMTIRFFNSVPHIALLGLLIVSCISKLGNCNDNTKKFTYFNLVAMHVTFIIIVLKYILFVGEDSKGAVLFIEYYSGIFIMQIITIISILFQPNVLKKE